MDASLAISIAALVIAIVFGIRQQIHIRKVDQELFSGGTTLLEVRWIWQNVGKKRGCFLLFQAKRKVKGTLCLF